LILISFLYFFHPGLYKNLDVLYKPFWYSKEQTPKYAFKYLNVVSRPKLFRSTRFYHFLPKKMAKQLLYKSPQAVHVLFYNGLNALVVLFSFSEQRQ